MDFDDRWQCATVLVVDDEECLRIMIDAVLEQEGFNVLTASSGEEALRVAHGHGGCIDVLLVDLCLQGMSGDVLAVRFSKDYPDAKVVFMTASSIEETEGKLDGETVLFKPFHIDRLLAAIRDAVEGAAACSSAFSAWQATC